MKKALITGSRGFIGDHMYEHLAARGWDVLGLDSKFGRDIFSSLPLGFKYDLVIHAAAYSPFRKAIDTNKHNFPVNVMLDAKIFEWALRERPTQLVYLSSSAVYPACFQTYQKNEHYQPLREGDAGFGMIEEWGPPFDTYGWTKLFGERLALDAQEDGLHVHIVRPFSGYGEDQGTDWPFGAFVQRAKKREAPFVIWGSESQVRDWIHIDDVCEAIMAVVENDVLYPVNICTGIGTSMRDLAQLMMHEVGYSATIEVQTDAPLGVHWRVGDTDRFHEFYVPKVTIEEGVRRALRED